MRHTPADIESIHSNRSKKGGGPGCGKTLLAALSVAGGYVDLRWETGDTGRVLQLRWQESGVPKVLPRSRCGFGSFISEESLSGLDGEVEMRFEPDGLICDIKLPVATASEA